MQLGKRPPGAADGVERPALAVGEPWQARKRTVDDVRRALDLVAGGVDEAQSAERQRRRFFEPILHDIDQLQAAAAEIAGNAVGIDEAHHDALRRQPGFLLAGQYFDR